jgi:two-component system nitrogen regulation response regulator NtrX
MPSLLIVDDEANIRSSLERALGREGYQVECAASVSAGRAALKDAFDFALLDVWFPDGSGIDLMREIAEGAPDTVVIMMSGHATVEAAVQATRLGAFDFLEKPISLEHLLVLLRNAEASRALRTENQRLRRSGTHALVGRSPAIGRLLEEIDRAGPTTARVLIQGENGTGKELVARALHESSPRGGMPFVAVNCSAIPEELIESELFGHERGAFTGATQSRRGRFEEAHQGTLFLDEVADLSPRAQTKLLRVLQESELTRVGGNRTIRVDVRVISASNQDLHERVRENRFREDLYFRIAVVPITVPPLRDRREDVPLLVEHFAGSVSREAGVRSKKFTTAAMAALAAYGYPGNVRELRNIVERLLIMSPGSTIDAEHVRPVVAGVPAGGAGGDRADTIVDNGRRLADAVRDFERKEIEAALAAEGGSMTQAAARLGLERSHLYKKMKRLGWKPETWKP